MRVEVNKYSISITGQSKNKDFIYGALPKSGYIYIDKNGVVRASNLPNKDFERIAEAIKQNGIEEGRLEAQIISTYYYTVMDSIVKIRINSYWDTETYKDEENEQHNNS